MTYVATETSIQDGSPVEVYEFALGSEVYRFSSGEESIDVDGVTYEPLEVSRTTIIVDQERQGDVLTITLPASTPLVREYINVVPGQQGTLTIRRIHRTDVSGEFVLIFKGLIRSVAFTLNGLTADIAVQPITSGLSRSIPRYVYSGGCNNVLYGPQCGVNSSLFRHQDSISTVVGSVYTIANLSHASRPDGWATGGFMVSPNGSDFRLILDHTGDVVTLLLPFTSDVAAGQTAEVFAGCAHDIDICGSKFSNVPRYGGYNWVPRENVFIKGV